MFQGNKIAPSVWELGGEIPPPLIHPCSEYLGVLLVVFHNHNIGSTVLSNISSSVYAVRRVDTYSKNNKF